MFVTCTLLQQRLCLGFGVFFFRRMKLSSEKEAMHNMCFSCGWVGGDAVSTGSFRCPHCCKDACKGESFVSCFFMKIDQYAILRKFLYLN